MVVKIIKELIGDHMKVELGWIKLFQPRLSVYNQTMSCIRGWIKLRVGWVFNPKLRFPTMDCVIIFIEYAWMDKELEFIGATTNNSYE